MKNKCRRCGIGRFPEDFLNNGVKQRICNRCTQKSEEIKKRNVETRKVMSFEVCTGCNNYVYYNCCCYRCTQCNVYVAHDDSWECLGKECKYIYDEDGERFLGKCYHTDWKKRKYECKGCKCNMFVTKNLDATSHIFNEDEINAWLLSEHPKVHIDILYQYGKINK
jgi:hypothetical protein